MITVAERILHAIELYEDGKYEFALEQAVIAIDISAQRYNKESFSSRTGFIKYLRDHYWIIELMALNGVDLNNSCFSNFTIIAQKGKLIDKPNLWDILYHSVRCELVHSTGIPPTLDFVEEDVITCSQEYISLPSRIFWALLSVVVFSEVNISEKSEGNYYLSYDAPNPLQKFQIIEGNSNQFPKGTSVLSGKKASTAETNSSIRFLIKESWGKPELLRPLYEQYVNVRVALHIPQFS
jgi:hypothetical protein